METLKAFGRRLVLWLWPLLLGLSVAGGSLGVGWGVAEVTMIYAWWLPAYVFRKPSWPIRPQSLAFAYYTGSFTSLFFAALAGVPLHIVTRWPTWVCLAAAPIVAAAVTAAVWPAHRRYHAARLAALDASEL